MAVWTAPTTRSTGALVSASIWNTDIVENLKYLKDSPVFDGDVTVGDDLFLGSGAVINIASGDITITHSTNTLTFAGAASGYAFQTGIVSSAEGLAIAATKRLYIDGVAGTGDTYISEEGANVLRFTVGGASNCQLDTTGIYLNTAPPTTASAANAWVGSTSDYLRRSTSSLRYKHAVERLDTADARAALMAMRPVTYRGKTDEDQRRYVGFIAEEMQQIAPLLCTYDEGGESGTPNYVTYDRVTAYLVAVVQQQQAEIDALKARSH
jgi:hypothetical protein